MMVMFCNMKNRNKMKLKCTNCGKEFPKEMLAIECPDCYILGGEKERTFVKERILELIDELGVDMGNFIVTRSEELKKEINKLK